VVDLMVWVLLPVGFAAAGEIVRATCRRWLSTPRRLADPSAAARRTVGQLAPVRSAMSRSERIGLV
jgi:hypothetical protein